MEQDGGAPLAGPRSSCIPFPISLRYGHARTPRGLSLIDMFSCLSVDQPTDSLNRGQNNTSLSSSLSAANSFNVSANRSRWLSE